MASPPAPAGMPVRKASLATTADDAEAFLRGDGSPKRVIHKEEDPASADTGVVAAKLGVTGKNKTKGGVVVDKKPAAKGSGKDKGGVLVLKRPAAARSGTKKGDVLVAKKPAASEPEDNVDDDGEERGESEDPVVDDDVNDEEEEEEEVEAAVTVAKKPSGVEAKKAADGAKDRIKSRKFTKAYKSYQAGHDTMPQFVAEAYEERRKDKTGRMQCRVREIVNPFYERDGLGSLKATPDAPQLVIATSRTQNTSFNMHSGRYACIYDLETFKKRNPADHTRVACDERVATLTLSPPPPFPQPATAPLTRCVCVCPSTCQAGERGACPPLRTAPVLCKSVLLKSRERISVFCFYTKKNRTGVYLNVSRSEVQA